MARVSKVCFSAPQIGQFQSRGKSCASHSLNIRSTLLYYKINADEINAASGISLEWYTQNSQRDVDKMYVDISHVLKVHPLISTGPNIYRKQSGCSSIGMPMQTACAVACLEIGPC